MSKDGEVLRRAEFRRKDWKVVQGEREREGAGNVRGERTW